VLCYNNLNRRAIGHEQRCHNGFLAFRLGHERRLARASGDERRPADLGSGGLGTVLKIPERAAPAAKQPAALKLENVTVAYDRHPAVHHLSGEFATGSLTALVGPNGGGKSTLLKAITGLVPLASGHIDLFGRDARALAYLPQVSEVDRGFPLRVIDVVNLGHWRRVGALGRITAAATATSTTAIARVGLKGLEQRSIAALSVGQFQRVLFARLIVQDAAVILLDEPFNAIDQRTTEDLLALVESWSREGRTVIAALHDIDQVRRCFPQALLLAREPVAWGRTAEILNDLNLARARALAEGWQDDAEICRVPA
jgi:zinc/manganese transport system ATP-binding protein